MFTGIIEELGKILYITKNRLTIEAHTVIEDAKIGDSIAVNGVCLTVTAINSNGFDADVSSETFRVTALSKLKNGLSVNLERAIPVSGRFGGHIVSGHIDGVGKILLLQKDGDFYNLVLEIGENESKYVVKKGSIAINGISLTVAEIDKNTVEDLADDEQVESASIHDSQSEKTAEFVLDKKKSGKKKGDFDEHFKFQGLKFGTDFDVENEE